jgi:hypothetical protein
MLVYFRKRLPEVVVNDCNQQIVRHGLKLIRSTVFGVNQVDWRSNRLSSDRLGL